MPLKDKRFTVELGNDIYDRLTVLCDEEQRSRGSMIRYLICKYYTEKHGPKPATVK